VVSAADPLRSLISAFYTPEPPLFFQVAPHLSSQGLSGPRSRPTATQKNLVAPGIEPGTAAVQTSNVTCFCARCTVTSRSLAIVRGVDHLIEYVYEHVPILRYIHW
jgi:hypothetical protein